MNLTDSFRTNFVRFAIDAQVLRFGSFTTKAGRNSPYFFNAGLFNSGALINQLAGYYAQALIQAKVDFDMLFGPAYKGIPLATATAMALANHDLDIPFAYNRKEAKDHGEGGTLVGAPLKGKVVIIDDVISAGTSVRESVELIRAAGATPAAVLIALDRMEKGGNAEVLSAHSAVEEVQQHYGIPVVSIASLRDILALASEDTNQIAPYYEAIRDYREKYGVN